MNLRKLFLILLMLVLFAGAVNISVNAQKQTEKQTEKQKDDDDADDSPEAQKELAKQAKVSKDEAQRIALLKVSGKVLDGNLSREDGKLVYEFDIRDQSGKIQEVQIDARTGESVSIKEEVEDDEDKEKDDDDEYDSPKMQQELAKEAKISLEEARKIALARVPGTVTESEMGNEKGKVVYEFEIKDKDKKSFDVMVDAKTGEIIGVEEDRDEDVEENDNPASQATSQQDKWYKVWRKIPGLGKKKI